MSDNFANRLRQARKHFGFNTEQAAELAGLKSRKSWENYEKGNGSPKVEALQFLVSRGLNTQWLVTGEGEMLVGSDTDQLRNALVHQGRFSDVAAACLSYLYENDRQLSPEKAGAFLLATYFQAEQEIERSGGHMSANDLKNYVHRILQIHDALVD